MIDREFQLTTTPLQNGVTFLEASAGTGKTYTISKLVVRLLAEKDIPISSLLVMTFTEAATRELKERIRKAIQETLLGLSDTHSDDLLAQHYRSEYPDLTDIQNRLRTALATFDEARIFTIHGFCHRILNEFAFESNQLFEPTLIKEPKPLWREAIEDFWRTAYYQNDGFVSSILEQQDQSPETLLTTLLNINRYPQLEVLPAVSDTDFEKAEEDTKNLWKNLHASFASDQEGVLEILGNASIFKKPLRDKIPTIQNTVQQDFPPYPTSAWLKAIKLLSKENLENERMQKHNDVPLELPFFDLCEAWNEKLTELIHQHTFYCLRKVREALANTKRSENLLTFDDLLPSILGNLESTSGARLLARIQSDYSAALIDEFQDTDPQQTELFKRLFITPDHFLYFIGDPKQAIYKFRGADIFSYLEARLLANQFYTLSRNWRSDPRLVEAVNGIFSNLPFPFLFKQIAFISSNAALEGGNFLKDGKPVVDPFKLCYLSSEEDKLIDNNNAKTSIRYAMVREILQLLGGSYELNAINVQPSDIAILTRSNKEAHEVRTELLENNISSVIYSDQTVFETREAEILQILLNILLEPNRLDWLRGLYVSEWFDWPAEKIVNESWIEIQEKMYELHQTWQNEGVVQALDEWIHWSRIKPILLARNGGERSVTNLLHLVELLGKAEFETKLSPLPLLQWLNQSMLDPDKERDDFITRLENDDQAIQIVTIHKSKGLQYPIVFVPFAWNSLFGRRNEDWIYHREENEHQLVFDNRRSPGQADELQFKKETLSDAVRLLYVALTRAKSSCYLFWGDFKSQESSSIGHVFGLGNLSDPTKYDTPSESLRGLKKQHFNGIQILDVDEMAHQTALQYNRFEEIKKLKARDIVRIPERGFYISSFSSLATGFIEAIEDSVKEEEEDLVLDADDSGKLNIFSMDKGTVAGNLIHDILEQSDFTSIQSIRESTEILGQQSLLDNQWIPILQEHLSQLSSTVLISESASLKLNGIPPGNCLKECEFHFPTRNTSTRELLAFFKTIAADQFASNLPGIESWTEYRLKGFLRGFIDLLFKWEDKYFILDWKSNWLGNHPEDYNQKVMNQAMAQHAYFLQYYLYTLAAVRYLQIKIPNFEYERHFGGIYYIFVRGISQNHPGGGVFFDRPKKGSIQDLDSLFKEK
jgi:exodeoxyribonuclease V beta subunit